LCEKKCRKGKKEVIKMKPLSSREIPGEQGGKVEGSPLGGKGIRRKDGKEEGMEKKEKEHTNAR